MRTWGVWVRPVDLNLAYYQTHLLVNRRYAEFTSNQITKVIYEWELQVLERHAEHEPYIVPLLFR